MTAKTSASKWSILSLACLLLLPLQIMGQTDKRKEAPVKKEKSKTLETELSEAQLPAFAISLVISLANEARSYNDVALRPRVLARAADMLWDADNVTARSLFKRAWDEAVKGDKDEVLIKKDVPAMAAALLRSSGRDLRVEVLGLIARRDRTLAEEFFETLRGETEAEEALKKQPPNDNWIVTDAISKRFQVALALLKDGQIDRALEFAAPVLNQVNVHTIGFLSQLRMKNAGAADRVFMTLLARAELDPAADANTVSGLSSYIFTPGLFVTFQFDGGARWTQPDEPTVPPPDVPEALRNRFFEVASGILLRPVPPKEHGVAGRVEKYNVIRRLLPLFERYAPETAASLRAQLVDLASYKDPVNNDSFMLTQGITPEPSAEDALEQMQSKIDRAKTSRERDSIYAAAAFALLNKGDERARDVADKIEDPDRRTEVRQNVDFEFVQRAIRKKSATEALRMVQTGKLSNTQRASAYIDVARILRDSERQRALELLEEAVREINRIEGDKADRALMLVGVANQFFAVDRVRAWEIIGQAVKEANRIEGFTGESSLVFPLMTRGGVKFISVGGENFSLTTVFRTLAKDDLYRAVDLTKTFKYDAPRATATLAIASSILKKD